MKLTDLDFTEAQEEVSFARRDGLPLEVEVLRLEDLLKPPHHQKTTVPTRSSFHTLILIDGGGSFHHVDFERYRARAGDLFVIPHGCVQAFHRARLIEGYMAVFTDKFLHQCRLKVAGLAEASQILLYRAERLRLCDESLAIIQKSFATLADYTDTAAEKRFAGDAIASAFSLLLFSLAGTPETTASLVKQTPDDELVAQFLDLLEARYREEHQASFYAKALSVSLRTLDRRLVSIEGQTTRQAVSSRLILEARRLLTRKETPIKNIALELGFSESQNFTRFLRSQIGLSPQAFRKSLDE